MFVVLSLSGLVNTHQIPAMALRRPCKAPDLSHREVGGFGMVGCVPPSSQVPPILTPCHAHGLGISMGISGVSACRMVVPGWEVWALPDLPPPLGAPLPEDHLIYLWPRVQRWLLVCERGAR